MAAATTRERLELTQALIESARDYQTPFFLVDPSIARRNLAAIRSATGAEVHYAVKANPHSSLLRVLAADGAGFEVASLPELRAVLDLGIPATRIVSSNPVKTPAFLAAADAAGLRRFAFDSPDELRKLAALAPGAQVYCRVAVDNSGSDWPLSRKHGAHPREVVGLLRQAAALDLEPIGLTFHVGSQCLAVRNWRAALLEVARLWREAAEAALSLRMLNLGGGFPVRHLKVIPDLHQIGQIIRALTREHFPPETELIVEPGRALVGSSAILVSSVIGKADRGGERWLYLDAGVFNALMESIGGFAYEVRAEVDGPRTAWTLAGPSCDSVDTIQTGVELPELSVGDRVHFMNAGAYTLSYASSFNGFGPPEVHVVRSS